MIQKENAFPAVFFAHYIHIGPAYVMTNAIMLQVYFLISCTFHWLCFTDSKSGDDAAAYPSPAGKVRIAPVSHVDGSAASFLAHSATYPGQASDANGDCDASEPGDNFEFDSKEFQICHLPVD